MSSNNSEISDKGEIVPKSADSSKNEHRISDQIKELNRIQSMPPPNSKRTVSNASATHLQVAPRDIEFSNLRKSQTLMNGISPRPDETTSNKNEATKRPVSIRSAEVTTNKTETDSSRGSFHMPSPRPADESIPITASRNSNRSSRSSFTPAPITENVLHMSQKTSILALNGDVTHPVIVDEPVLLKSPSTFDHGESKEAGHGAAETINPQKFDSTSSTVSRESNLVAANRPAVAAAVDERHVTVAVASPPPPSTATPLSARSDQGPPAGYEVKTSPRANPMLNKTRAMPAVSPPPIKRASESFYGRMRASTVRKDDDRLGAAPIIICLCCVSCLSCKCCASAENEDYDGRRKAQTKPTPRGSNNNNNNTSPRGTPQQSMRR